MNRYGGELDDAIGLANLRFVLAYKSFDPSKNYPFPKWVSSMVWGGLRNSRKPWRHGRKEPPKESDMQTSSFNITDFLDELSVDAQCIVELLFDTPKELAHLFCYHEGTARQNKSVIRQYLRKQEWTIKRIDKSFTDIKLALQ